VRLLDFGIARLLADSEGDSSDSALTQLGGRALTPDYASPEQIRGDALTIASDQYALGVLLYELLAGQRPYKLALQSVAQLEQAIVAAEVLPPSRRVVEAAAAASGLTTKQLARQLAGDLDAIVLKALARVPAERYATLAALADDLDRQRDGLPVRAQPPSRPYRLRKFVVRHKANAAISAALAATLVIATAVSLTQAQHAREQAELAQREARRAQAVTRFVTTLFEANSLDSAQAARRRSITAEQLLIEGAERIGSELSGEPALQRELQGVVGRLLHELSITEPALAVRLARLQSIEQAGAGSTTGTAVTPAEHAAALRDLADSLAQKGDIAAARARYDEAIMLLRDREDDARLHWALVAQAGYLDITAGESARGAARVTEAADTLARIAPQSIEHAEALILLGEVHSMQNRSEASVTTLAEGLALAEARLGTRSIRLARHQFRAAAALDTQRRTAEAEAHYRRALQTMTEVAGPTHPGTATVQLQLGRALSIRGRPAEARPLLSAAAAVLTARGADLDPLVAANAQMFQAEALLDEGRIGEAGAPLAAAMARYDTATSDLAAYTVAQATYARYLLDTGRYEEAIAQLERARARRSAALGADHPAVAALTNRIGLVHMAAGRDADAQRFFAEVDRSQAAREAVFGSPRHLAALNLAAMDIERGRHAQALPVIEQALTTFESLPASSRNRASELALRLRLARALLGVGRAADAQPQLAQAKTLAADLYEHAPQYITWHTLQARYLAATGNPTGAREELRLARQSLAAQGVLGPHFARTLQRAEQELGLLAAR
jgi:eukaryotic-like serine/threonine-protein kinase